MSKLITWLPRLFAVRSQYWLAAGFIAACVLPFMVLSFDSHPSLDDFQDAITRKTLGFWQAQRVLYEGWTGRFFTSVLLTDLSPLRWAAWPALYFLVPLATLLAMAGGLFVFFTTLTGQVWSVGSRWLAAGALLSLWLAQAPSVAESLYWYNGVAVYSLPGALFLLWLGALVRLDQSRKGRPGYWRRWATTTGLSVILIGSNEILALMVLGGIALWAWRQRTVHIPAVLSLVLVAAIAAAVTFLAPGNLQRLLVINRSIHLGWAAVGAVGSSAYLIINWLGSGLLLAATALALPALMRLTTHANTLAYRVSRVQLLLLLGGLLALLVATGLPSYAATGGMMPPRARTTVYLLFLVGWVVLLLVGVGYARRRWPTLETTSAAWPAPVAALLWAWLLLNFVADHNVRVEHAHIGQGSNNIVLAYRDWLSGAAGRYDAQLRARYQQLFASRGGSVRVAPLLAEPPTLLYYDITTDSAYWGNVAYAQFFKQRAVWVGPGGHAPPP